MSRPRARGAGARLAAAALGAAADRLLGELPGSAHPLRAFGVVMARVERLLYRDGRAFGALYTLAGVGIGALSGLGARSVAAASYLACGGRALAEAAGAVDDALGRADLPGARAAVRSLVGRDVADLDEGEIARATVESVAENTVDALIAPLCFAALAGAPGALSYRAVNSLDALVGYRSPRYQRFGWASARLDDLANYLPARLTALLVGLVRPRRAREVWRIVRRDAPGHPSPNAGVAEAAFAAALGVRLGGTNSYGGVLDARPELGDGRAVLRADISRAVRLSQEVGDAAFALLLAASLAASSRAAGRSELGRCRP